MKATLERLFQGEFLSREQARSLLSGVTAKAYPEAQIAALATVFRMRPITPDELIGFRQSLLDAAVPVDLSDYEAIDIVGTGGDGKNTFNISTCACFVVAGAGGRVIKHGNYGASSVSGASTVLEQHGVRFTSDAQTLRRSIETSGVAYLHAQKFHPALASVGPVRRAIGVKTFFNLLGPLVNPARPRYQLLGVADLSQLRLYNSVLQELGIGYSIVTSLDGYDEISLTDDFKLAGKQGERVFSPEELGLERAAADSLAGGDTPEAAARIFDQVLNDTATPAQKNAVLVNAAFALRNFTPERSIADCLAAARESIESGRARQAFERFIAVNA